MTKISTLCASVAVLLVFAGQVDVQVVGSKKSLTPDAVLKALRETLQQQQSEEKSEQDEDDETEGSVKLSAGAAYKRLQGFSKERAEHREIVTQGKVLRKLQEKLRLEFEYKNNELGDILKKVHPKLFKCPYHQCSCNPTDVYRTIDGRCNNLNHPLYGAASTPFTRLIPAAYEDGLSQLKTLGKKLPNPRLVSANVIRDGDSPDDIHVNMVMQWGQFLDHDITHTPKEEETVKGETRSIICGRKRCSKTKHEACAPIRLPKRDPFFQFRKPECLNFVRSTQVPSLDCTPGPVQQLNALTAFIDGSAVYGSSDDVMKNLRDTDTTRGRMKVIEHNGEDLLPQDAESTCSGSRPCFKAGDKRANIQPGLTTMHTLWVREHNRVEAKLFELHPEWTGEKLFQEARKIVGAETQHITYNEFLPVVLGHTTMSSLGLASLTCGHKRDYDDQIDATLSSAFSTAAYRFGHNLIPSRLDRVNASFSSNPHDALTLSEVFFNTDSLYDGGDKGVDDLFTGQMTKHLHAEDPPIDPFSDIVSLNIQRGRDHGLPGYLAYREHCGLPTADDFSDLHDIPCNIAAKFADVYKSVGHIDLFIAGAVEDKVPGALVGPTFSCILGKQFQKLKNGDRFWYENTGVFTAAQLRELRRVTLSRIICDNSGVENIAPNSFFKLAENGGAPDNALVPCADLPSVDLTDWQ